MPSFSDTSKQKLATCHPDLITLFEQVVIQYDCTILCGIRGEKEQTEAFRSGFSKLPFPESKHNSSPSNAVDVSPYPIIWDDRERFYHFAGYVQGIANMLGINIRWGGDWDGDFDFKDQRFMDLVHFELS